ncbi:MAG: PLP-dependent aminotransferase family protein, partial [Chloroflexota bacterium]
MELAITLDESKPEPLYRQLYEGLRLAILSGRILPGQKLPSSRALARRLSLSRNTVTQAYAELQAEGFLTGRHGSGSYLSQELPDDRLLYGGAVAGAKESRENSRGWLKTAVFRSRYGGATAELLAPPRGLPYDFNPGQGAWDCFPRETWRRLLARQWKRGWRELMDYGEPAGYRPLREQVASYLSRSRAVRCSPEEVVIVNGTQQALDLLGRLLLQPGHRVAVENPGYRSARQVFSSYEACLLPIPVDEDGLVVEKLRGSGARMVLVTPSHQFPTGAALSLPRRLSLLTWAHSEGGLVLEDDYDSEFRFEGRPLASLQGLDDSGSVVYLG